MYSEWLISSIWTIGTDTSSQSGSGSKGNEGVLRIAQISSTEASASDIFSVKPRTLVGESYTSEEMT